MLWSSVHAPQIFTGKHQEPEKNNRPAASGAALLPGDLVSDGSSPATAGEDRLELVRLMAFVRLALTKVSCLLFRQRHPECGKDFLLTVIRSWQTRHRGIGINGVMQQTQPAQRAEGIRQGDRVRIRVRCAENSL